MADPKKLEDILKLLDPAEQRLARQFFDDLISKQTSFQEAIRRVNQEYVGTMSSVSSIRDSIKGTLESLTGGREAVNKVRQGFRALSNITAQIESDQQGIHTLSLKEIRALKERTSNNLNLIKSQKEFLETLVDQKGGINNLSTAEQEALLIAREQTLEEERLLGILNDREDSEKDILKTMGLSGSLIKGLVGSMKKLGIEGTVLDEALLDAKNSMRGVADAGGSSVEALKAGFKSLRQSIEDTLVHDPIAGFGLLKNALLGGFNEVNKAATETTRLTGEASIAAASLNTRFATSVQYLQQLNELTKQLGISANLVFDKDTIAAGAEIQNLMGLTAEEAGKLSIISKTTNNTLDNSVDVIVKQVSAFNRTNRAAVNQRLVLGDIANTSEDILVSLGNQPTALANAASAARRLGLALSDVDRVAGSLLDFESSIENELQAQLLTGRNINLAKARELALTNDLAGLGQELFNNSVRLEEFASMNRIAQEGQAKALGLSRQELAKIALQRSIELGLSNKALETAAGITAEQLKATSAADAFNISVQKIQQALAGPAAALAGLVSNAGVLAGLMAGIGAIKLGQLVISVTSLASSLAGSAAAAGALAAFTNPVNLLAGIAAIAVTTGLITAGIKKAKEINDGVISPDGGLLISGPKGSFVTNKDDYITASTRPMVAGTGINSNRDILDRLDKMVSALEKKGTVTLDGYKVGEAMVIGSYNNT